MGLEAPAAGFRSPRTPEPAFLTRSAGQPDPTRRPTVFRTGVDLVALDVCVRDRDGRLVPALAAKDFVVLENNTPQELQLFVPEGDVPLSIVLLIDRSASMAGEKLERAQAAARAFLRRLGPEDEVEVMAFNELADRRLAFTSDRAAAERAVNELTPEGQTSLYESIMAALRDLQKARRDRVDEARDALLVLTDGEDTSSRPEFDYVLEDVRRSGVIVYAVSLGMDGRDRCVAPSHELLRITGESGGRAVAVTDPESLTPVYEEIASELRHLYRLAYVPTNTVKDGAWRTITVKVPSQNLVARTRAGYYATRPARRLSKREGQ
jgi:VWFA-related protein